MDFTSHGGGHEFDSRRVHYLFPDLQVKRRELWKAPESVPGTFGGGVAACTGAGADCGGRVALAEDGKTSVAEAKEALGKIKHSVRTEAYGAAMQELEKLEETEERKR
jgi:hypothetical protein